MYDITPKIGRLTNRRVFVRNSMATVFSVGAGVAIGMPGKAVAAAPCTGPYGTGDCGNCSCRGSRCSSCGSVRCSSVNFCGGGSCWSSGGGTCCDCRCQQYSYYWYCYCYG
jgi:hypothetical protein